jgi:hypothetical protein
MYIPFLGGTVSRGFALGLSCFFISGRSLSYSCDIGFLIKESAERLILSFECGAEVGDGRWFIHILGIVCTWVAGVFV